MQKRFSITIILVILLVTFITGTIVVLLQSRIKEVDVKNASIRMSRSACFGKCPVYSITIKGNGNVVYDGTQNVSAIGIKNSKIDITAANDLFDEMDRMKFDTLNENYRSSTTDVPRISITYILNGKTHTVSYDNLQDSKIPSDLADLDDKIDYLTNSRRWTGTAE